MRKTIYFVVVILLSAFLAKQITAERAHILIKECISQEEMEIILDESVDAGKEKQFEITKRALVCVHSKQTWLERLVTKMVGIHLFD